jgi:hypothetical protein
MKRARELTRDELVDLVDKVHRAVYFTHTREDGWIWTAENPDEKFDPNDAIQEVSAALDEAGLQPESPIKADAAGDFARDDEPVLRCPKCGNEDVDEMQYWEEDITQRDLLAFGDGLLIIDSEFSGDGDGDFGYLVCKKCEDMPHFPIPDSVSVDYV